PVSVLLLVLLILDSVLVCLILFYSRYGALRDLHSFPTRRSSDLNRFGRTGSRPLFPCRISQLRVKAGVMRPPTSAIKSRISAKPDRKSTRLNSSHVKISYAVFCLKKKKHIIKRVYVFVHVKRVTH